ncbi:hypothetical protein HH303_06765 [Rhodospirillaceae bacterium KN72]|uniref:Uncharacterized protein n=1 Tax=Pacificispira spongiicola TaxID=2729598 RepID=A0A7Y0DYZ7_9PROT|nr:hypothetical protein [Pacificispira spongiicola]NMM44171.1 hypothetical protein [Pacificispira spongiicola]
MSGVRARFVGPLGGSLFISFLTWNYKLFLVVFSSKDVVVKIEIIESVLYGGWLDLLIFFLILPVLTTAAFLLIYPFPSRIVAGYWHWQLKKQEEYIRSIDKDIFMSREEALEIRRREEEALKKVKDIEVQLANTETYISRLEKEKQTQLLNSKLHVEQIEKSYKIIISEKDKEIGQKNNDLYNKNIELNKVIGNYEEIQKKYVEMSEFTKKLNYEINEKNKEISRNIVDIDTIKKKMLDTENNKKEYIIKLKDKIVSLERERDYLKIKYNNSVSDGGKKYVEDALGQSRNADRRNQYVRYKIGSIRDFE